MNTENKAGSGAVWAAVGAIAGVVAIPVAFIVVVEQFSSSFAAGFGH